MTYDILYPRLHTLSTRCANDALSISQHGQPLPVHHFGPCALLSFSHTLLFSVLKTDQILPLATRNSQCSIVPLCHQRTNGKTARWRKRNTARFRRRWRRAGSSQSEHFSRQLAHRVQKNIDDYIRDNEPKIDTVRPRGVLFITDRSMDPVAPFDEDAEDAPSQAQAQAAPASVPAIARPAGVAPTPQEHPPSQAAISAPSSGTSVVFSRLRRRHRASIW
ncbi:unnamed protein product [Tilletia controversa]|nr:unnamed protein product [Tilletia controversa]CAD6954896.1 unnamed protein product [Tilletia caries]